MTTSTLKIAKVRGFTLVETAVALVVLAAMLSTFLPLFGTYRAATIRSDIRLGALAVTQRVMDELRHADVRNLPTSGTFENLPPAPDGTGESTSSMVYKGKTYRVAITYCDPKRDCTVNARRIRVRTYLRNNPDPLFQLETVYTELRN